MLTATLGAMSAPAFQGHALPRRAARHSRRVPRCAQRGDERLLDRVVALGERARELRCPFWRRRFVDVLDTARDVMMWAVVTRHKRLGLPWGGAREGGGKRVGLAIAERLALIRDDFVVRQYYVTGRLSKAIYADDCLFDGPDPDVPVRGLDKYTDATAGLFDRRLSRVDLLEIGVVEEGGVKSIRASWRLEGALNLPWKPAIKPYTGETVYTFNEQGLVVAHNETWSISALDAFVSVIWPRFGAPPAPPAHVLIAARALAER